MSHSSMFIFEFGLPQIVQRKSRKGAFKLVLILTVLAVSAGAATMLPTLIPKADAKFLTYTVGRGDLTITVTEQGTLESSNNTEITCKVRGFSTVTWVIEAGTIVKPGDELVRLDTKLIEEQLSLTKTNTFVAKSTLERTRANLEIAKIAKDAYLEGRYRSQLQSLDQAREIALSNLETSRDLLSQSKQLYRRGYVNDLDVQGNEFTVRQAQLELQVTDARIKALTKFTREMELETLEGNLKGATAKFKSDEAALRMENKRQARAQQELDDCVIVADRPGLVIYPSAAAWKDAPDIAQGATVRKNQVLLLMPDLEKMQVKVGIHESIVDRVHPGMKVHITMPERTLEAEVTSVAAVTKPAGWWTGNVVKYDTVIELPQADGLKPGMTAEVEIVMAEHHEVLTIPVAGIVESDRGSFCWVSTPDGPIRRVVELGDTNEVSVIVKDGLQEGEEIVLNPAAYIDEAQEEASGSVTLGAPIIPLESANE